MAALGAVFGLVAVVVVAGQILDSRKGTGPAAVAQSAPLAIVEAAPEQPATSPAPDARDPPLISVATETSPPISLDAPPARSDDQTGETSGSPGAPRVEAAPPPRPEPALPARPLVVRRRQRLGQEALRRQLSQLPELMISHHTESAVLASHGVTSFSPAANRIQPRGLAAQGGFLGPALAGHAPRAEPQPQRPGMLVAQQGQDDSPASVALVKRSQPELGYLPWRMGDECHLPRESAEELEIQSRLLRNLLQATIPAGDTRPDADSLRAALLAPAPPMTPGNAGPLALARMARTRVRIPGVAQLRSDVPAAIPALMQLLMAERTPARLVLVEILGRIEGPAASKALARLAIFDLDPEVREQALVALRDRPARDYRPSLLDGLRYPWAPASDHAAEALVALEDREATPALVTMLDELDPEHPRIEVRNGQPVKMTRSLVQVNHLRNCLLCHAPSTSATTDLVRGRVPTEGMPLPPPQEYYASKSPGEFVRAEVTYLRQDFSVTQPVEDSGPWPAYQRYDYIVYERPVPVHGAADPKHKARPKEKHKEQERTTLPQRESVLFVLRELTGAGRRQRVRCLESRDPAQAKSARKSDPLDATFRLRRTFRNQGLGFLPLFLAWCALNIYVFGTDPKIPHRVAMVSFGASVPLFMAGLSGWMLAAYWREELEIHGERVSWRGVVRTKDIDLRDVTEARWRKLAWARRRAWCSGRNRRGS